jgi:cbb3-type cytochrome oxidase subunit 1
MAQLWLSALGLVLIWVSLSIGGMVQGSIIHSGQGFYAAREALQPFFIVRIFGGLAVGAASVLLFYNVAIPVRQALSPSPRPERRTVDRQPA